MESFMLLLIIAIVTVWYHTNYFKNPERKVSFPPFYKREQKCTGAKSWELMAQPRPGRGRIKTKSPALHHTFAGHEIELEKQLNDFLITMALLEWPPPWNSMVPKASVGLSWVCLLMDHFSDWMSFRERRLWFFSFWRTETLGVRPTCWPIRRPQQHLQHKRSKRTPWISHYWNTHLRWPAREIYKR